MKNIIITLLAAGLISTAFTQCARPVEPQGGAKDTIAPIAIRSVPAQFSKNMSEKKLEILFNEYITLKELQKNFYMTPAMEVNPTIRDLGKKLQITFEKPLNPNTTYALNFGNAIVDVNENNPINDFTYIFSTGNQLDTLKLNGVVYDAKTMQPVPNALIFLYENDSLETPLKHKPDAISRSDKNGIFIANTLKNKQYKIIAIKDANRNYLFDPGFDEIAFDTSLFGPVSISQRVDSIPDSLWKASLLPQVKLKMFAEQKKQQFLTGKGRAERYKFSLYFNAPNPEIKKLEIKGFNFEDLIINPDVESDTINYWFKDATRVIPDTLVGSITYMKTDSTGTPVEVSEKLSIELPLSKINIHKDKKKGKDEIHVEKTPSITPIFDAPDGTVNSEGKLFLRNSTPLISMDTSRIALYHIDDNDKISKIPCSIKEVPNKLSTYEIRSDWQEDSKYKIVVDSNVLVNIQHYTNDSIGYNFTTSNAAKYGTFILDFSDVKAPLVVQILDSKYKIVREKVVTKNGKVNFPYIKPDKYYIRIIEDKNENKKWDTGEYLQQLQPERVAYLTKENEKMFLIRAGWENELSINVSEVFSNY